MLKATASVATFSLMDAEGSAIIAARRRDAKSPSTTTEVETLRIEPGLSGAVNELLDD